MRIKKISQAVTTDYQVNGTYSTSQSQAYSCDYVNNIIETYEDANGRYVKYANGLLIQYNTIQQNNITVNTADGSLYRSANIQLGNFPIAFYSTPKIFVFLQATSYGWVGQCADTSSTNAGRISIYRPTSTTSATYSINYMAVGTWK